MLAAHRLYRTAESLDTVGPYYPQYVAYSYLVLGDLELAQRWFNVSAERFGEKPVARLMREYIPLVVRGENPERLAALTAQIDDLDLVWIYFRPIGMAHLAGGNLADARTLYVRFFPEFFASADDVVNVFNAAAAVDVAWILRSDDDVEQADALLNQTLAVTAGRPAGLFSSYLPDVRALAMLGRETQALAALRQRIDDGWREAWWLTEADPTIAAIVDHPDFIAMLEEVKADVAVQLELVREMERNGEIGPVPEVAAAQ